MATYKIPVVAAKVSGSHTDFPALVIPSEITDLPTLTLAEAQSSRFYSDEALTTELAREVVSADEIHVKTGMTTSTDVYIDYDGVRSDYATTATYGAEAVWSDYEGVWHLNEDTGTTANDSTSNNYNGTANNTRVLDGATGKLGNAADFTQGTDYVEDMTPSPGENAFTFYLWIKTDDNSDQWIITDTGTSGSLDTGMRLSPGSTSGKVSFRIGRGSYIELGSTIDDNNWHHLVLTWSGSGDGKAYIDGSEVGDVTPGIVYADQTVSIGARTGQATPDFPLDGLMDEVGILNSLLSANWITTEYNNQNDNGSFWGTAVEVAKTTTHTLDSVTYFKQLENHTLDTHIKDVVQATHTIDTAVTTGTIATHTLDTTLQNVGQTEVHTLDSIIKRVETETHTLDAGLFRLETATHTIDSAIFNRITATHTLDTHIKNVKTETHTLDTFSRKTQTTTNTIDTVIAGWVYIDKNDAPDWTYIDKNEV